MIRSDIIKEDLCHIISHTSEIWSQLSGKKIFLTGGTGFFGKWLLESFLKANEQFDLKSEIHILSRNPKAFNQKHPHFSENKFVIFHQGDVRDFEFPKYSFDYIIHAASAIGGQDTNNCEPLLISNTILEGTRRALELARLCKSSRFLFISSGAVYGKQPPELTHITEEYIGGLDLTNPGSSYGEAKRMAELYCAIYGQQYGVRYNIARCFAFVGPYLNLDAHYAIGNFIRDGLENSTIEIKGDGTPYRSYLYAADLAIWLWTILLDKSVGNTYNVGSDQAISIVDLARKISQLFEREIEVIIKKLPTSNQPRQHYVPNINLAKNKLGLKRWIDIDNAIQRTIDFYRL